MQISDNFSLKELTYTSHKEFQVKNLEYGLQFKNKLSAIAFDLLQPIRELLAVPLIITSGVRCPDLNFHIGGSLTSQHCKCEAVDFIPKGYDITLAFDMIRKSNLHYGQLIREVVNGKTWLHISLGEPYREPEKCNQTMYYDGKSYQIMDRI